jgi:MYXO-CTERM domain-containing protein
MRHGLVALTLAALLIGTAGQSSATVLESCCACIPVPFPEGTVQVAFCAEADSANFDAVDARCAAVGGHDLACFPNIPGPTCFAQLADEGIACPTSPAPALSPHSVVIGLLLLSGIGLAALRRR